MRDDELDVRARILDPCRFELRAQLAQNRCDGCAHGDLLDSGRIGSDRIRTEPLWHRIPGAGSRPPEPV
ncbi:hypothetical protein GCM10009768_24470 [Leucobacter iarius]|uniref:Uncharacterized protein n=1 Tax=Leucobacter iarius TaxID=333963 RepID=A0ABN2LNB8_9MICO